MYLVEILVDKYCITSVCCITHPFLLLHIVPLSGGDGKLLTIQ